LPELEKDLASTSSNEKTTPVLSNNQSTTFTISSTALNHHSSIEQPRVAHNTRIFTDSNTLIEFPSSTQAICSIDTVNERSTEQELDTQQQTENNFLNDSDDETNQLPETTVDLFETVDMYKLQHEDTECMLMINYLERGDLPMHDDKLARRIVFEAEFFILKPIDGKFILYHFLKPFAKRESKIVELQYQLVVPSILKNEILRIHHDNLGHQGTQITFLKIRNNFYWRSLFSDVRDYISSCDLCQRLKNP
jgi:hypothetical protein